MRHLTGIILSAVMLTSCAGTETAPNRHAGFTQHYEESLFQVTEKGMFSIEMVVKEHELRTGVNTVDLIVHDRNDRDVIGAAVEVTPWMPDMGHGVMEKPAITERGGGLYTVDNVMLIMSGHWELRVSVKADSGEDRVVFDFPDVKVDRGHDHKAIKAPALSDLDLSTSRVSAKGIYSVSYGTERDPLPVNAIHSWTLDIQTPDSRPVRDAEVFVDGDMPEHGHGLPTQPEVTEEISDGRYLVEGMKFSMPGWWVVKFVIKSKGMEDSVSFNLFLKE